MSLSNPYSHCAGRYILEFLPIQPRSVCATGFFCAHDTRTHDTRDHIPESILLGDCCKWSSADFGLHFSSTQHSKSNESRRLCSVVCIDSGRPYTLFDVALLIYTGRSIVDKCICVHGFGTNGVEFCRPRTDFEGESLETWSPICSLRYSVSCHCFECSDCF